MSLEELEQQLKAAEEELEAAQQRHVKLVADSKATIAPLQAQRDQLLAEIEAARIVDGMSDGQRAALAQKLHPNGIASGEKVGTPGR